MTENRKKSIQEQITEIFPNVKDIRLSGKFLSIDIDLTIPPCDVTFEQLSQLSVIVGTRLIDLGDFSYSPGCETCDYGARKEVTISCRDVIMDNQRLT